MRTEREAAALGIVGSPPPNLAPSTPARTLCPRGGWGTFRFAWEDGGRIHLLLAQLPGHVAALEALQVVQAAGQPASSLIHTLAPIGQ